ncbi:MAG: undecaprenyldiphospho-muramoylpentapeptide beta-N-acetylglucosaminyltransferase [Rhodopila sp.]|jgi:UDP-N-acetylglucosamine--N-acetylmuramyl-(pentapeptide) pyrophosphoryl-undecaprenol N-acetylglucosamine transferase
MRGPSVQPIVIAAGGTGGHFFPAEALAAELVARGHRIVLMTDARSGALSSPTFAEREQYVIRGAGIAGRGLWRGAKAIGALAAGVVQARGLLARIGAGSVVGFGGYPSVAPVLAARLLRRRPAVILHEQNAVLGLANRFLAGRANTLALGFENTQRIPAGMRTAVTGNPVRPAVAALSHTGYVAPADRFGLLVLGGSLGARVFSDVVPAALRSLPDTVRARLSVVQQTRPEDMERVKDAYAADGITAELAPFFPDVAARLMAAHLVIARAGASTVAELAVAGRPSILVPLPGAIDDHQSANAHALAAAGGAWVVPQIGFTPALLAGRLRALLADPAELVGMATGARSHARADAAARLADLVEARMAVHAGERA